MADRRPRRADARRNHDRLVEQARDVFSESGVDASLDEIARRAGVASGTLYRHFPTRSDLVEAVLGEQVGELVALGRRLLAAEDPFDGLCTWLRAALTHGLAYRGLAAAAMTSAPDVASAWHAEMFDVGAALTERARAAGAVVDDADAGDVLTLVGAVAWAVQDDPHGSARAQRLLDLVVGGLRRGGGSATAGS